MKTKHSRLNLNLVATAITSLTLLAQTATAQQWSTNTLPPGLIAWWQAEGNMLDSAGAHHGSGSASPTYAAGRFGQAFQFNGTDQSVAVPDVHPDLDSWTQFTLEAWINLDKTADFELSAPGRMIFSKVGNAADEVHFNQGYQFGPYDNATKIALAFNTNGQAWPGFVTVANLGTPLLTNTWYHLVGTYDHNAAKIYLNGVPLVTNVIGPVTLQNSGSSLRISKDDNLNGPFAGRIDDARIYNRALSASEIAWLAGGPPPGALGVWGLKTHDPTSQAPTTLFHFNEGETSYTQIGQVTLSGADIEADGLAQSPQGNLFAFRLSGDGSQLVSLNPTTAVATVISPILAGRDMRGATFLLSGKLIAFDDAATALVGIDPATGTILGQPVPITGLIPGAGSSGDLTQMPDGSVVFAESTQVYRLDLRTGTAKLLLQDTNNLPDGNLPYCCGVACSPRATPDNTIFAYEASIDDDVYQYLPSSGFARSVLIRNVVPAYNAGRGDLAALPAARVELLNFSVSDTNATLETVCRAGVWAWVEFTDDLTAPNWQTIPGTMTLIPYSDGSIAMQKTWTNLSAASQHRFFRVAAQ